MGSHFVHLFDILGNSSKHKIRNHAKWLEVGRNTEEGVKVELFLSDSFLSHAIDCAPVLGIFDTESVTKLHKIDSLVQTKFFFGVEAKHLSVDNQLLDDRRNLRVLLVCEVTVQESLMHEFAQLGQGHHLLFLLELGKEPVDLFV